MNTEIEQAVGVAEPGKAGPGEVVTRLASQLLLNSAKAVSSNKRQLQTAYMVVRAGRPYFYATINKWNPKTKTIKTGKRYLGTSLPRGYRLGEGKQTSAQNNGKLWHKSGYLQGWAGK